MLCLPDDVTGFRAKATPFPGGQQCLSESLHLLNLHYSERGQVLHLRLILLKDQGQIDK